MGMTEPSTATETPTRAAVAEEVRALLGRRRMSDIALARGIGRSHTYVYRRLTGETAFDVDDLARIANVLGVRLVDLLPRDQREATLKFPQPSPDFYDPLPAAPRHVASRSPMASTYPTGHRPSNRPNGPRRPVLSRPPMAR